MSIVRYASWFWLFLDGQNCVIRFNESSTPPARPANSFSYTLSFPLGRSGTEYTPLVARKFKESFITAKIRNHLQVTQGDVNMASYNGILNLH